jgi:hypothetical protein
MNLLDEDFLGSLSERLIEKLINEIGGMKFSMCLCTLAQSDDQTTVASYTKIQPRIVNAEIYALLNLFCLKRFLSCS